MSSCKIKDFGNKVYNMALFNVEKMVDDVDELGLSRYESILKIKLKLREMKK